jgi:hypothetical protein
VNIKILATVAVAFSFSVLADPTFKSTIYVERGGDTFREEYARQWPKCTPIQSARKIYLDKTNELREVAYWDKQGKIHEAGKDNNPDVHKKVDEIFAATMSESANPCVTPKPTGKSSHAIEQ